MVSAPGIGRPTVAHLITTLESGGAEAVLRDLVLASREGAFRHVVVSMTGDGVLGRTIRESGVPVWDLGLHRGRIEPAGVSRLRRILVQEHPAVLQTWMYHADLLGTVVHCAVPRPALIWALHAAHIDISQYGRLSAVTRRLCVFLSSIPDGVVANSPVCKNDHVELGYKPKRWHIIGNGFDLTRFRPDPTARVKIRAELGLWADAVLIGLIAREDPMKDHETFFDAAALVLASGRSVQFVLAGDGVEPSNPRLMGMVERRGLRAHVHLLGFRSDVEAVSASLDIACSASAFGESFCNAVAEAMACGVPCVVTNVANLPTLVADTGVVVPPRDPKALADAVATLVDAGPSERQALGQRARQRIVANFGLQRMVEQYEQLYASLIEAHAPINDHRLDRAR